MGVLLDTSCPALRRNEDINLSVSLCLCIVTSTNFSSFPISSLEDASHFILWVLECHQFYLAWISLEKDKGRHGLRSWVQSGLLRKGTSTLPVSAEHDQGELDPHPSAFTKAGGIPPRGVSFLFLPHLCSSCFWSLLPTPFSLYRENCFSPVPCLTWSEFMFCVIRCERKCDLIIITGMLFHHGMCISINLWRSSLGPKITLIAQMWN